MAFPVATIAIRLGLDSEEAVRKLGTFDQGIAKVADHAPRLRTVGLSLLAVANDVGAVAAAGRAAALQMAELNRRADQLGTSVGKLDRFTRTARALAGVQFDRSIDALETFQERVGEAVFEPDSPIAALFDRLNVEVSTATGAPRAALAVWDDFVEAIGRADRATRNFVAAELGGVVRDLAVPMAGAAKDARVYEAGLREYAAVNEQWAASAAEANKGFEFFSDTWGVLGDNLGSVLATVGGNVVGGAGLAGGFLNRLLFGTAGELDFKSAEEANAYLDDLDQKLQAVDAQLDEFPMLRRNLKLLPDEGDAEGLNEDEAALRRRREELVRLRGITQEFINAASGGDAGTRDNQFVAEITRQFELASTKAAALAEEIERLRDEDGDPALIRHLEQLRQSLLQQREIKHTEAERLELQLKLVGLSSEEARLATLRHRLEAETDGTKRAQLQTEIELEERLQAATAAATEQAAIDAAIAELTTQIERAHYGIEGALLAELDITREQLAKSPALRAMFEDMAATRREQAEAAREEALYGDVNRQLDVERARATGLDLRLHRHLVELQRQGVKYGEEELDNLEAKLQELDKLTFANNLRDDLRDAVGGGLRDGLREFAEGGDIGDVFDEIGRRLSSLLLDLAIGGFGQDGSGGTGLLGWLGGLISGQRERGGPVDAGRLYLVGERGPELFMPRVAGNVLASVGAGPAVTQQITVQGAVRSDADVAAIAQRVSAQAAASVLETIRNGRAVVA